MKNYRFPSAPRSKKRFNPANKLRTILVLGLIGFVSSLPFYTFAQSDAVVGIKTSGYAFAPGRGAFLIYAGPNGETLCREATAAETRALKNGTENGLRQINHLKNDSASIESATGLTIILRGTTQLEGNQAAKQAFIAAAAKWESLIKDPITIAIDVDFGTTFFGTPFSGSDVIGATESPQFLGPYTDIRQRLINHASPSEAAITNALPASSVPSDLGSVSTVYVTSPLLRALGGLAQDYTNDSPSNPVPAPRIGFNTLFGFDFDPNDGITGNRTDFDAVAVHEMGHALGFDSAVGERELDPSSTLAVSVWDIFRFRPSTATLANFGTAQRVLSSGGSQVQFNGGAPLALSTGRPDSSGGDGNQASHWKDSPSPSGGTYIGIMDPTIARNVREVMTVNDQNAIDSFGYTITATTPPPNDNFVNAETVNGNSGTLKGTNAYATKESGEPNHSPDAFPSGKSIWYRWTAPNSGTVTITTAGSTFDTVLAIYTGTSVAALSSPIASNDDAVPGSVFTSSVSFSAVSGTTYQIAVDGYGGDQGNVTLNWNLPATLPNSAQFTTSTATATEALNATTKVDLTVTRSGNTTGAATVTYATSDGTASERSDYLAALGTLRFAANETSKTITVFVVNDSYGESPETFNLTLTSSLGSNISAPANVVITINSDESSAGVHSPNPVKDPNFSSDIFVREHYVDFFNREADPAGLGFWKNQIDECTTQECREIRRINVSAAFFLSIEFQQTGYLVYKTYQAAYDTHETLRLRDFLPDTQEIGRGVVIGQPGADAQLEANKVRFFNDFVQRTKFLAAGAFPTGMTAAQFVDKLNANTYAVAGGGGALTQQQRDDLVNQLTPNPASAALRASVLRQVAENGVFHSRQFNRAFVLMQYFGYLRRNPNDAPEANLDFGGYNFWLGKLNQFGGNFVDAEMVKAFITAGEYQQRFGP